MCLFDSRNGGGSEQKRRRKFVSGEEWVQGWGEDERRKYKYRQNPHRDGKDNSLIIIYYLCAVMCGEESLTLLLPKHSIAPEHKEHFSPAVIIKKHGKGWTQKQQVCIMQWKKCFLFDNIAFPWCQTKVIFVSFCTHSLSKYEYRWKNYVHRNIWSKERYDKKVCVGREECAAWKMWRCLCYNCRIYPLNGLFR